MNDDVTLLAGLSDGRLLSLRDAGDGELREVLRVRNAVFALTRVADNVALATDGEVVTIPLPAR